MDEVRESLVNDDGEKFGGDKELQKAIEHAMKELLFIGIFIPKSDIDRFALSRFIAFGLVKSGVSYSEMLGELRIGNRILAEHSFMQGISDKITIQKCRIRKEKG